VKLQLRPQIPGGDDPELLWGSILLLAALLGTVWLSSDFPTPLCPLHALSGIPCPTCGTTRAATALLHVDFKTAFLLNPLMAGSLMAAGLYVVYAAVVVIGRMPRARIESVTRSEARVIRVLAILLIAANWLYLVCPKRT
jgi:hypothetical protein